MIVKKIISSTLIFKVFVCSSQYKNLTWIKSCCNFCFIVASNFLFDAILFTIIAKVKGYKLQVILSTCICIPLHSIWVHFSLIPQKDTHWFLNYFLLKVTPRRKNTHIFSVSLSLTKSIDAILNKNWFWFCIIPQTQVWPWYNLSSSSVPTKICD